MMPDGLMAYYKGDIVEQNGAPYLRDCVGGHHALITNANYLCEVPTRQPKLYRPKDTENELAINEPSEALRANVPVVLSAKRSMGIRSLAWSVPALGIENLRVAQPTITFPKAGTYEVSCVGSDYEDDGPDGVAREVSATCSVVVGEAPELDASFTATASDVASGDRISFSVRNPVSGYAYRWLMPGADVETAGTLTAGAVYQGAGTYEVTLVVTAPTGEEARQSMTITVSEVVPVADFDISEAVVLKGSPVKLVSTSRHRPTSLQWTLAGTVQKTIVNGAETFDFTPEEPGIYNITLKATNDKGSDSFTQNRALIVTNADSQNGLNFTQSGAYVSMSKPIFEEETTQALTLDWWMNPSKLVDYCLGIGESTSSFLLRTDSKGVMYFHNSNKKVQSGEGYVVAGEWHHYAIVYNKGAVKFFRDGELVTNVSSGAGSTLARPATFCLGTSSAEMTGAAIDEFRVWRCTMSRSNIQGLCNQPLEDYEEYISGGHVNYHLCLYYPCNQTGGDVEDITSNGNTGRRIGFGPDGDAWGLSRGVFCLNFGSKQPDVVIDGIEDVETIQNSNSRIQNEVYDLSGRRITGAPKPGLYIIDGRKRVIR